jgi:hypothetical protein
MKKLLTMISAGWADFVYRVESFMLAHSIPDPEESFQPYVPKCGHYFDVSELVPHQITLVCDYLFSLGVKGFGVKCPPDRILNAASMLIIAEDNIGDLKIYFFPVKMWADGRKPLGDPQSLDHLTATIEEMGMLSDEVLELPQ